MKKLLIATMILFGAFVAKPALAVSEAGPAAQLAFRDVPSTDPRVARLRAFLASYNSPLADEAETFVTEADKNNLDWKLVAAIAGTESTFGKEIPSGSYNGWGWGIFTGAQDGVHFKSWADGIAQVSEGLRKNYVDHGAKDIYAIGWIYAANGNSWANHTRYFIDKLESFQPAEVAQLPVSI